jgi:hypothetical protein
MKRLCQVDRSLTSARAVLPRPSVFELVSIFGHKRRSRSSVDAASSRVVLGSWVAKAVASQHGAKRPSGPSLAGRLRAPNKNPAQGMGIRAPTERGSEIPQGTLGWGYRRYARGRLRGYAVHRHAASKGFAVTFRQPSAGNVRASGAASTLQRSRGIPHTRHPSRCTSVPPDPILRLNKADGASHDRRARPR